MAPYLILLLGVELCLACQRPVGFLVLVLRVSACDPNEHLKGIAQPYARVQVAQRETQDSHHNALLLGNEKIS